jgi:hypothetical protein
MNFDSKTISNFLSDDEITVIENLVLPNSHHSENFNPTPSGETVKSGDYYVFDYYDPKYVEVVKILGAKLKLVFGTSLFFEQIHIFDCVDPYRIHSDVSSGWKKSPFPTVPAWTLIIPLDTVDSHTIVFKEGSNIKEPQEYVKKVIPYSNPTIDSETKEKYFSHIPGDIFNWLTIEDIFKWEKGSLFAAARHKFHTSDNFPANGVANKRALIAWTRVPE